MADHTPIELLRERLEEHGERRLQGLAVAESALRDIADATPGALASGLQRGEIAAIAGVSPHALDAAVREQEAQQELHRRIGRQLDDISSLLEQVRG